MNKKAGVGITLSVILAIILLGLTSIVLNTKLESPTAQLVRFETIEICVGDNSTKLMYRINTNNPECDINNIIIKNEMDVIFDDCKTLQNQKSS